MPTRTLNPFSGHLVPSHLGLAYVVILMLKSTFPKFLFPNVCVGTNRNVLPRRIHMNSMNIL